MPIRAEAPYGTFEFPDGTDPAVMQRVVKQHAPGASAVPVGEHKPEGAEKGGSGLMSRLWSGLLGVVTPPEGGPAKIASTGVGSGVTALWDNLLAGKQGVSRFAADKAQLAPDKAQAIFAETDSVQDARTQFAARNPDTGKMAVYQRSPGVQTSRIGGAADAMGTALSLAVPGDRPISQAMPRPMTPAKAMAEDYRQAGVRPNLPAVAGTDTAARVAQAGNVIPIVGQPIRQAAQETLASTAGAAERVAAGYGTAAEPASAGASAQNAIRAFAGNKAQAATDYQEFYRLMHGAPPTALPRTLSLLTELRGRFPSAPEITGLFTNPKLSRLAEALEPRTVKIPAETSQMLDQFGRPAVTRPATTVQRGGQLTTNELKELRSQVGYLLENPQFGPEAIPRAQVRRLYGALTNDMHAAAAQRGPAAAKALSTATTNYGTRMRVLDRLDGIINNPSPEGVFARLNSAAQSTASADSQLLQTAKKAMPRDEWGNLAASVIAKMGRPTPGARDVLSVAPDFSLSSFATNWNRLSPRAKDLLFDTGKGREGMDRLARIVQSQKNVAKFANVSRSGELILMRDILGVLGAAAAAPIVGAKLAVGAGGGWAVSKMLASPKFADWLFKHPQDFAKVPDKSLAATRAAQTIQRVEQGIPKPPQRREARPSAVGP